MSRYAFGTNAEVPGHAASRGKQSAASRTQSTRPKPGVNTTTNPERELKALHMMREARLWIDENPDAWAFIVSRALHETFAVRQFGMKQLIEEVRRKDFADIRGARTGISNSHSPAFARILIAEHPECRRFIVTKHSVLDEVER